MRWQPRHRPFHRAGFREGGAAVSICARGADALEKTRSEIAAIGGKAQPRAATWRSEADIKRYIAEAAHALGGIDVLVNNAPASEWATTTRAGRVSLDVDLLAAVRASHEALPHIEKVRGSIVNISSGSGLNPSVRTPAYGAAKAAVIHYTRTLAAAVAHTGVRVNCVAPGSIEFPGGFWEMRKTKDPALYNATLAADARPAGMGPPRRSPTWSCSSPRRWQAG